MKTLDLSIVTISMNHGHYLRELCESLYRERSDVTFEMILIDNCSSDETQLIIKNEFPWMRLVTNRHIRSFSYNNNTGIYLSKGPYILALNPDIIVCRGALKTLIDFMEGNVDVGACGPKLFNPDMSIQPSCRKYSTPLILLLRGLRLDMVFPNNRLIKDYMMINVDKCRPQPVDWLTGSAMMLRREALSEVGGFDENYPLYFEDQDLCRRMWEKGWRVCYVPQSQMIHYYARDSAKKAFSKKARMHYRSMFYYLYKYYNISPKRIEPKLSFPFLEENADNLIC